MTVSSISHLVIPADGAALPDERAVPVLVVAIFTKAPVFERLKLMLICDVSPNTELFPRGAISD